MKYTRLRALLLCLVASATAFVTVFSVGCLPIGPVALISGGRLRGDLYQGPEPRWSQFADVRIIELQVDPESPRSVNVGFFVEAERPFVSATLKPSEKRWPRSIAEDSRVVIRIDGTLYARLAYRVTDEERLSALLEAGREKFDPSYFEAGRTWFFELRPPK